MSRNYHELYTNNYNDWLHSYVHNFPQHDTNSRLSLSDIASKFLTVTHSRSRKPYKLSHVSAVFEATPHSLINFAQPTFILCILRKITWTNVTLVRMCIITKHFGPYSAWRQCSSHRGVRTDGKSAVSRSKLSMMRCPIPLSLRSLYHTRKRVARKKNTSVLDSIKFLLPLNMFCIDNVLLRPQPMITGTITCQKNVGNGKKRTLESLWCLQMTKSFYNLVWRLIC